MKQLMGLKKIIQHRMDSVAFRYVATVILVVFITQIAFGLYQIRVTSNQYTADLERKANTQAHFLASVSPEDVFFGNFLPLEILMRQTAEDDDIVYSIVVNNEERALTRYLNREDEFVTWAIAQTDQSSILALTEEIQMRNDIIEIRKPIVSEGVQLGEVRLGYTTRHVQNRVANATLRTILTSIIVTILISIFTTLIFYVGIAHPMSGVIRTTQRFAAGSLDSRLPTTTGNSEIERLKKSFNQMADTLQETIQALEVQREEARKLAFVAQHTDNMVVISDEKGNIEWVNDAFVEITGYTHAEIVGKRPGELLQGPKTDMAMVEYMRSQLQAEEGFRSEIINYNKAGQEYWVDLEVQPVYNDKNQLTNFIAIESDISERKIAEMLLQNYAQELERSNQELQEFAYVASHDLQEPLRKIQAFGSRLSQRYNDVLDERGADYLRRMINAAERMQNLIIALLDFSRVTTQGKPFSPTDLNLVLQEVLEDLDVRIEETQATIKLNTLPTIDADRIQMRQLLQNLIGNALKFTKEGIPPMVEITGTMLLDDTLELRIKDNGIGLDEKYAERIFNVFQRLHGKNEYSGTGVGLAVCRKIVTRHKGSIAVQSQSGQGSTFIIKLPVRQPNQEKLSTQEVPHV